MRFSLVCVALVAGVVSCGKKEKTAVVAPVESAATATPVFVEDHPVFSGENAYNRTAYLVSLGERVPGSAALAESVKFIEKEMNRFGWTTVRQTFTRDTIVGKKTFTNVRARLSGGFESSPAGVVGCHIDTKVFDFPFTGANDGASHTAVMLELARIMGRSPDDWRGVEIVFFDGEECFGEHLIPGEDGLYGSQYYVEALGAGRPGWMLNLDMLGARRLKIAIPGDTPQELYLLYRQVIKELKESEDDFGVAYGSIYDDHYPFLQAGIPAINLIADFHEGNWWHTPRDTMDIISAKSLERSGKFAFALLKKLHPGKEKQE